MRNIHQSTSNIHQSAEQRARAGRSFVSPNQMKIIARFIHEDQNENHPFHPAGTAQAISAHQSDREVTSPRNEEVLSHNPRQPANDNYSLCYFLLSAPNKINLRGFHKTFALVTFFQKAAVQFRNAVDAFHIARVGKDHPHTAVGMGVMGKIFEKTVKKIERRSAVPGVRSIVGGLALIKRRVNDDAIEGLLGTLSNTSEAPTSTTWLLRCAFSRVQLTAELLMSQAVTRAPIRAAVR